MEKRSVDGGEKIECVSVGDSVFCGGYFVVAVAVYRCCSSQLIQLMESFEFMRIFSSEVNLKMKSVGGGGGKGDLGNWH